jgi:ribosomal protein S18 acetylase RimI-like enzyme
MPSAPVIRRLVADDAAAFREIRLAGLIEAPTAFGSSYAAEKHNTVADFAGTIGRNYLAGAWVEERLIGVTGFYQLTGEKTAHRGNIWGVYVDPGHRGHGVARALLEHVLEHAKQQILQVHLCVVADNEAALALYEHLGFVRYGVEPRSLRIAPDFYDEQLLVWRAD